MNDLNTIISTFSIEDKQRFLGYLEKNNKRHDVKNVKLFKLLSSNKLSSKEICHTLYGSANKDAYHALRKRLYQSILNFTANSSLEEESSIENQIIKYILASRFFLQQKQYNPAFKILYKAENIAKEHHLFVLLNEIYNLQIQYANHNNAINLDELIIKFETNKKKHVIEEKFNIIYARIKATLNDITYGKKIVDIEHLLNTLFKEYNVDINESMSFKSLYQLMSMVSLSALATKDYFTIEPFLVKSYNSIITYKNKERQPFYHIQILYIIANTYFRNKKFGASLEYLHLMHSEMLKQQKKYYNTFLLKYHLLLSLNLNFSNKQEEAIELLKPLLSKKHTDIESLLDIHLSLIMFYFQNNELKKALNIFAKFYHTDKWYVEKVGIDWVLKKNLAEILLHIELGNIDLVESRLLSFQRNHYVYLKDTQQDRAITFIELVKRIYKKPEIATSNAFKETIMNSFEWVDSTKEDIFVMSFYAWLKSKVEREHIYKTTMSIINDSKQ
ncbi:hypothetical protein [Seonamhaeicola marinus]|uniref:Tetratricopeptide repeat protein n=1 Tax=Seonamhaeicola marinus TaxID=1912246 RepID=A0A5D0HVZ3_9FLAO|nr:hypothetical protein [Seonamhaeicola marinus]TYA75000.1 hypothetical protein FUA24_17010 [Seonamhaeicola marinus]